MAVLITISKGKFNLGTVVITRGVYEEIPNNEIQVAISRHNKGDWGNVSDPEINEKALIHPGNLMSVYKSKDGVVFWIITEWDRSVTTVLLPNEY